MGIEGLGRVRRALVWYGGSRGDVQLYLAKEMCGAPLVGM